MNERIIAPKAATNFILSFKVSKKKKSEKVSETSFISQGGN